MNGTVLTDPLIFFLFSFSSGYDRLVERIHLDFVRAGARFDAVAQARYKTIMTELAEVTTLFQQHILGDESSFTIDLSIDDLAGCPDFIVAGARQAAIERNKAFLRCDAGIQQLGHTSLL